jgi:hypothetical protein
MPAPVFGPVDDMAHRAPRAGESVSLFGRTAYATSKLCNVLFAHELVKRLPSLGRPDVHVLTYDPGAMPTGLIRDWLWYAKVGLYTLGPLLLPGVTTPGRSGRHLARLAVDLQLASANGKYFSIASVASPLPPRSPTTRRNSAPCGRAALVSSGSRRSTRRCWSERYLVRTASLGWRRRLASWSAAAARSSPWPR